MAKTEGTGLRRRLVTLTLGIRPKDIARVTTAGTPAALAVKVTDILNGEGSLPPDEAARLGRLIGRRSTRLFAQR